MMPTAQENRSSMRSIICSRCNKTAYYTHGYDACNVITWCKENCKALRIVLSKIHIMSLAPADRLGFYQRKILSLCEQKENGCLEPKSKFIVLSYSRRVPRKVLWENIPHEPGELRPTCINGSSSCCNMDHAVLLKLKSFRWEM